MTTANGTAEQGILDKTQTVTSYTSAAGITIYEREQYNKATGEWHTVGDSSENEELIRAQADLHNARMSLTCEDCLQGLQICEKHLPLW